MTLWMGELEVKFLQLGAGHTKGDTVVWLPKDKLTTRESEVCERILVGFTSTGISLDLGIAESSVNTYRRRAYEKLEIATQNELFSMCISALNMVKR